MFVEFLTMSKNVITSSSSNLKPTSEVSFGAFLRLTSLDLIRSKSSFSFSEEAFRLYSVKNAFPTLKNFVSKEGFVKLSVWTV